MNGHMLCEIARSDAADFEAALEAAHAAKDAWGRTSVAERALILNRITDCMEDNLDLLALPETWDNGKPIRETTAADVPLAVDHFRYFAGAPRSQEGSLSQCRPEPYPGKPRARWQVPNIFFQDMLTEDDDFFDKAVEGFVMFGFQPE